MPAHHYRTEMTDRFAIWEQITQGRRLLRHGLSTARSRAPPRCNTLSGTHAPNSVTAPRQSPGVEGVEGAISCHGPAMTTAARRTATAALARPAPGRR